MVGAPGHSETLAGLRNIIAEGTNEYLFQIPLSEITYDDFANFVNVTRGLLWFVVLIVASDIMVYLVPGTTGDPAAAQVGQLLYVVACLAILVPAVLIRSPRKAGFQGFGV
jgi:hypothetical protein